LFLTKVVPDFIFVGYIRFTVKLLYHLELLLNSYDLERKTYPNDVIKETFW